MNRELLNYDPRARTRVRFSLMPEAPSKVVDVRTSPIEERIAAINDFVDARYEVHMNFSPVIVHEGWEPEWRGRFAAIDDTLSDRAKAQLKCEIIMLTHNAGLHGTNLAWQPKGEDLLWPRTSKKRRSARAGWLTCATGCRGRELGLIGFCGGAPK